MVRLLVCRFSGHDVRKNHETKCQGPESAFVVSTDAWNPDRLVGLVKKTEQEFLKPNIPMELGSGR